MSVSIDFLRVRVLQERIVRLAVHFAIMHRSGGALYFQFLPEVGFRRETVQVAIFT